ncbi:MAG: GNAT family N-acetyltransferase [Pseudobdellovibrionaceae bacterium]
MLIDSPLESQRFNIKAGKIKVSSGQDIAPVLVLAKDQGYNFLSCRIPTAEVFLFQELERNRFFLTDTLLYYKRSTEGTPLSSDWKSCLSEPGCIQQVYEIADKAFAGYPSHYAMDLRLDQSAAAEVYKDWAQRCCLDRTMATDVLCVGGEKSEKVAAFVSLKSHKDFADILLAAVDPEYQGQGLLQKLLGASLSWASEHGHKQVFYSTQIQNIAAQKALVRQGWEPSHSYYTLHCWL